MDAVCLKMAYHYFCGALIFTEILNRGTKKTVAKSATLAVNTSLWNMHVQIWRNSWNFILNQEVMVSAGKGREQELDSES